MASITLQVTSVCAGGEHVTITVTGDTTHTLIADIDSLFGTMDSYEKDTVVRGLLKLIKAGKTKAQFKAALTTGVTITV